MELSEESKARVTAIVAALIEEFVLDKGELPASASFRGIKIVIERLRSNPKYAVLAITLNDSRDAALTASILKQLGRKEEGSTPLGSTFAIKKVKRPTMAQSTPRYV